MVYMPYNYVMKTLNDMLEKQLKDEEIHWSILGCSVCLPFASRRRAYQARHYPCEQPQRGGSEGCESPEEFTVCSREHQEDRARALCLFRQGAALALRPHTGCARVERERRWHRHRLYAYAWRCRQPHQRHGRRCASQLARRPVRVLG